MRRVRLFCLISHYCSCALNSFEFRTVVRICNELIFLCHSFFELGQAIMQRYYGKYGGPRSTLEVILDETPSDLFSSVFLSDE